MCVCGCVCEFSVSGFIHFLYICSFSVLSIRPYHNAVLRYLLLSVLIYIMYTFMYMTDCVDFKPASGNSSEFLS